MSRIAWIAGVCALVILTGCGGKNDKPASQTAAKVNKEEITVHQINFMLQHQRGLKPEQMDTASRQVLERLIDQELALQKAEEMELDRDARVVQQLEAARREIIARAYFDRVSDGVPKPGPQEIQKYYDEKPAMFKNRHVYSIQEVQVEAQPDVLTEVRSKAESMKGAVELAEYLKSRGIKFTANQLVRTPEQMPAPALQLLANMKEGQMAYNPTTGGAQIVYLVAVRPQPVTLEQATPVIERLIVAERRRDVVAKNLKDLRAEAKVEYIGKFQTAAASAPAVGDAQAEAQAQPAVLEATTTSSAGTQAAVATAEAAPPAAPAASAASGALDNSAIMKGLGIK
ncbi:MAG: EpsD family peptidyl-prolyl cis-trans isomerase [Pseudomonadota bacterium]